MYSKFVELLQQNGKTVADVARATGISESVFSNWKNRDGCLSFQNIVKVAKFFDVPVDYFAEETA